MEPKKDELSKQITQEYNVTSQMPIERATELAADDLPINPLQHISDDFAQQLLHSLIAKGLSGQELEDKLASAKQSAGWTIFAPMSDKNDR